ncbi:large ribosomal subunit protein uL4m [Planococcus citri]|uniref:large ribosomal subunit protein uL4m n=1 Tax=Planococcus citri TaxID=170843 RepID=UPI0031F820C7
MLTSRLLGSRFPYKQLTRNFNFFRSKKDSELDEVVPITETTPLESSAEQPRKIEIPKRQLPYLNPHVPICQAWVENLDTKGKNLLGIIDLHPQVFGTMPRVDLVHENIVWQQKYKYISWKTAPSKLEIRRSLKRPWQRKGTGRARHANRKSHVFMGGAVCHGPRGPKTEFYMLPFTKRVLGLCATLSIKLAQDDIHFIDQLEIPTDDPNYLLELAEERKWGSSVLFVDESDVLTQNMALALDQIPQFMAMPAYGLNCYSMLKFETLVLTLDALERIEERLIWHLHNPQSVARKFDKSEIRY